MIPGVIRGVIASSWLRASDLLKAPNSVTTGQDIPPAFAVSRENNNSEFWFESGVVVSAQSEGMRVTSNLNVLAQYNSPLAIRANIITVVKKV